MAWEKIEKIGEDLFRDGCGLLNLVRVWRVGRRFDAVTRGEASRLT